MFANTGVGDPSPDSPVTLTNNSGYNSHGYLHFNRRDGRGRFFRHYSPHRHVEHHLLTEAVARFL